MRALLIYCHPQQGSYTSAVRDTVVARLDAAHSEVRLRDLYAEGFNPVLTPDEWDSYGGIEKRDPLVQSHVDDLLWCDTLIFIYPTWWHGLPANLKGWLDRIFLPGVAFLLPKSEGDKVRPALGHIHRLGVFTTFGTSWWLNLLLGIPGRRTLMSGVGSLLSKSARKTFVARYQVDAASPEDLTKHLRRVEAQTDRLIRS